MTENSGHGFTEGAEVPSKPCPVMKEYQCFDAECKSSCIREKIYIDGDFNDSYEARVKRATGKNTVISKVELQSLREDNRKLREALKEYNKAVDDSKYYQMWRSTKELDKAYDRAKSLLSEQSKTK